jgi:hypothetical protein
MLLQVLLAGCLIAVSAALQALFMTCGLRKLKGMEENGHALLRRRPALVVVCWILFLLVPVLVDIVLWAWVYTARGALPDFEEALYFSAVTFTTVGYGDVVLDRESRLLATFEAVNGWVIFGWVTALVMIVVQRIYMASPPPP